MPEKWIAYFDKSGAIDDGGKDGNFRILPGDEVALVLPPGHKMNQKAPTLQVLTAVGNREEIHPSTDSLGSRSFVWSTDRTKHCGPCKLWLETKDYQTSEIISGSTSVVIVEAPLTVQQEDGVPKQIPMTAITMQTVLSRCLGKVDDWMGHFKFAAYSGYNTIHFTPLQPLGVSGSCYSLRSHQDINTSIVGEGLSPAEGWSKVAAALKQIQGIKLVATTDLVLNHVAINADWLKSHPEAGYNTSNCPWLLGACELDQSIMAFSKDLARGRYAEKYQATKHINSENELRNVLNAFNEEVVKPFRMEEWFIVDRAASWKTFKENEMANEKIPETVQEPKQAVLEVALQTVGVRRRGVVVDPRQVASRLHRGLCKSEFEGLIEFAQGELYRIARECSHSVLAAAEGVVRYERLETKRGPVSDTDVLNTLLPRYFTPIDAVEGKTYFLANNGWIMGWDSTKDFAAAGSLAYLKRDLIAWSDSVKLNYGQKPSDNPWLWEYMASYSKQTATVFNGIRLDNCHSTPINLAKHVLTEARKTRPDLFVYAELFTGSRNADLYFERELGINALIREGMQSHNPHDLCYKVTHYGGDRFFTLDSVSSSLTPLPHADRLPLSPTLATNIFFDVTHDNPSPTEKFTAAHILPLAGAVASSVCATGSTRSVDELVPTQLSVVTERREYDLPRFPKEEEADENAEPLSMEVSYDDGKEHGTIQVLGDFNEWKMDTYYLRKMNGTLYSLTLHRPQDLPIEQDKWQCKFIVDGTWCTSNHLRVATDNRGNNNNLISFADDSSADCGIVRAKRILNTIHRQLSVDGYDRSSSYMISDQIFVVSRLCVKKGRAFVFVIRPAHWEDGTFHDVGVQVPGELVKVHMAATLQVDQNEIRHFQQLPKVTGLKNTSLVINEGSFGDLARQVGKEIRLNPGFKTGSMLVFECQVTDECLNKRFQEGLAECSDALLNCVKNDVWGLVDVQYLLYSCDQEEKAISHGRRGAYRVDGHELHYAGLSSAMHVLDSIRLDKDTHYNFAKNVEDGNWLLDYIVGRLEDKPRLHSLAGTMQKLIGLIRELPSFLKPVYFDRFVRRLHHTVFREVLHKFGGGLADVFDPLVTALAFATLQFYSQQPSSPLIWETDLPSIAAGLPFFSTEFMRAWGRDTFIAIFGILLSTGRYREARQEILGFARVMRHGLIPNLLDSGNNPRFNARDATWFFMYAVKEYCERSDEGNEFLKSPLDLKYFEAAQQQLKQVPVTDIASLLHFILSCHSKGISDREWNAGKQIDEHMTDEGFNIEIRFDSNLGMNLGGNVWNCGTWMDKMGSSQKAGNKGVPATPRDGAPVEIVGLLKGVLGWLVGLPSSYWPYEKTVTNLSYNEWNNTLNKMFEPTFYIEENERTKGTYRDTHGATETRCDQQLRCNWVVACAVAPEMFSKKRAYDALGTTKDVLFGEPEQLGMKTLDPKDPAYRPNYDNANDSCDKSVAHGWNYHNGPEWVWPFGYFLSALWTFSPNQEEQKKFECFQLLENHRRYILSDPWRSLPELTNRNGEFCKHSCSAQAWSVGTILDFITQKVIKGTASTGMKGGAEESKKMTNSLAKATDPETLKANTKTNPAKENQQLEKGVH